MHNKPGLAVGRFALRTGPMLAAFDIFEITITGKGTHAALPSAGVDAVMVAGQMIGALQTLVRSNVHPVDSAVVSVTQMAGGDTWNVIPETVTLCGTARFFKKTVQDDIETAMRRLVEQLPRAFGATATLRYERRYPPLVNHVREAAIAASVAADLVGADNVDTAAMPAMAAEDFSFMLEAIPGAFINIGNGSAEGGCYLHNPHYDFNDAILPFGASYWVRLVETVLPSAGRGG
jgi:hippurate hydrolase